MADKKRFPRKLFATLDGGDVVVKLRIGGDDQTPQYQIFEFQSETAFRNFINRWREDLGATEEKWLALNAEKMKRREKA